MRFCSERRLGITAIAIMLLGSVLPQAWADGGVKVEADGGIVVWSSDTAFDAAMLTIKLPGGSVAERVFAADEAIRFSPGEADGAANVEGVYSWQLVLSPRMNDELRDAMTAARRTGDSAAVEELRTRHGLPAPESLVHSGTFRVADRALVDRDVAEAASGEPADAPKAESAVIDADPGLKDQVFADDLIVIGSTCVGLDCVNGENFGFDTLRLKENNLRLHFLDTSNSASFPTNDWRIVANDSSNGGGNYLAVEDATAGRQVFRVDAGAPANALRVDSSGDVGLGTGTPVLELHVADGDSPAIRLEQNGSSGFTPQTWDLAGNETNFFVRDVTNGSKLPFRIRPGAPDSSIDIASNGFVGMGTASPDAKLHVKAQTGGGPIDSIHLENNGPSRIKISNTTITNTATNDQKWTLNSNGTFRITAGDDPAELKLDAAGNLTVSGSYKVNGTTLIVPDYVFDDGYSLMPLDELGEYVEANRHLPGIRSAAEVTSDVLDMTEMQLRLLQKIEELTLYTLQQEARIEALQSSLAALECRDD